jgi:hypothetical protein
MTAHVGRLRVKIAIVGWKPDGSSREPAYIVNESSIPIRPPKTRLLHTAQKFRTASPPLAALDVWMRVGPLKCTALRVNPMNGIKPEPDALRQSAQ